VEATELRVDPFAKADVEGHLEGICSPISKETKVYASFQAFHKMGTYLHTAGAKCISEYYARHGNSRAISARGNCYYDSESGKAPESAEAAYKGELFKNIPFKIAVHWTREPKDWILSNYLYHKRGDELQVCWLEKLQKPEVFAALRAVRPSIPAIQDTDNSYTAYLQRISVEDGIVSELFRNSPPNQSRRCESTLHDLVREAEQSQTSFPVCLGDFTSGSKRFLSSWHRILKEIRGGDGDTELDKCFKSIDPNAHSIAHSTFETITPQERARLLAFIDKEDASHFERAYATATEKIGCPAQDY